MTPTSDASAPRLRGLDGLRAIAVTVVILFHLTPGLLPGGYLGVDLFFVISGFLITSLLLREHALRGAIGLRSFWTRRARRLLPALALVVLASCAAALVIGGDVLVGIGRQVLGAATFSYNWLAIAAQASYFDSTTPELFRNLWSLAVEEQFYLLWPFVVLLLVLLRRRGWMLATVLLLAAASATAMVALSLAGLPTTRLYYGTDTHAFGLAIGAALALASRGWSPRPLEWRRSALLALPVLGALAVASLIALAFLLGETDPRVFRGGLIAVALLAALAIAGAVAPGSWLGRALDARPLRIVGERSYGLYLWHWPVFVLVTAALPQVGAWTIGGIALAITVAAAALSYRFIEQPVRRRGFRAIGRSWLAVWRSGPVRAVGAAVATLAIVALVAAGVGAVVTAPASGVAQQRIEAGEQALDPIPASPVTPGEPQADSIPGGDQIVMLGDSVMLAAAKDIVAAFPGIYVDAVTSRHMAAAPALVQQLIDSGNLRPILVLGLGTNGPVDEAVLDEVTALVGPRTEIILVNAQAPRDWIPGVNALLASYAQKHRNVELANWYDAIQPRLDVLTRDKIHAGGPIGDAIYIGAIRDAIQRLAELPPLLNSNDYGLSPRPT